MAQTDWVVYKSPLWHRDYMQTEVKPLLSFKERLSLENNFVNDAIRTQVYSYPRKIPIIPPYSASKDKHAQAYFQSPLVKSIMKRDREIQQNTQVSLKNPRNFNKLSTRHRVQKTPTFQEINQREQKFTNDAIVTERRRTRFRDIIPKYDATSDQHCQAYFRRRDIQRLINVTCSREAIPGANQPGSELLERQP